MSANVQGWLLKILGAVLGLALETLYFVYSDATRAFVAKTFGVSDAAMVSFIVTGMAIFGIAMLALIVAVTVYQVRKGKSKTSRRAFELYLDVYEKWKQVVTSGNVYYNNYPLKIGFMTGPPDEPQESWNAAPIERYLHFVGAESYLKSNRKEIYARWTQINSLVKDCFDLKLKRYAFLTNIIRSKMKVTYPNLTEESPRISTIREKNYYRLETVVFALDVISGTEETITPPKLWQEYDEMYGGYTLKLHDQLILCSEDSIDTYIGKFRGFLQTIAQEPELNAMNTDLARKWQTVADEIKTFSTELQGFRDYIEENLL